MSLAIIGQSNGANLWTLSGITTLSSTLNSLTGKNTAIIEGAVGGAPLLKESANPNTPSNHWGNKYDTASPIYAFLQNNLSKLEAVLWIGSEDDAYAGASVEALIGRYVGLRGEIAAATGRRARDLPFMLAMLGKATTYYANGWKARRAQEILVNDSRYGFIEGPEYIDLAVEADNIHMTAASRETFAGRSATLLAPIIKASGITDSQTYSGSFTRDSSLASGTQTVSGLPFTPTSITFSAALSVFTSNGSDNGTTASCSYADGASGGTRSDASIFTYAASSGNGYKGKVSAFGSGSFTVDWTKILSPGGTITINYAASG